MNWAPPSASNFSGLVDHLSLVLFGIAAFIALLVLTLLVFFGIRYRAGSKVDRTNPPEQNLKLEFALIGVILLVGLGTFFTSAKVFFKMYTPPPDAKTVYVTAKQWMWEFQNPEGKNTINDLTVTVNEPVKLTMISEDVIHSLFVPAFRIKQDVLPGSYTSVWFTPTDVGDYPIYCTQFCGLSHSEMRAMIHVIPARKEVAHVH